MLLVADLPPPSPARADGAKTLEKLDVAQPKDPTPFERRELLGVHSQPQPGKNRVGVHVPVGRLSVHEARQIADLADKYVPGGEVRLTVEQNVILPNVDDADLKALLAEPCLNGDSRLSVEPGNIVGNLVSCTGSQFCGLAMIETKQNAESIAIALQKRVRVPKALRIHWTGCPNSCGQVQAGDIGLMGGPAKKMNAEGKMKAVPGCKIFIGGVIGEDGHLAMDASIEGIPLDPEDLLPVLTDVAMTRFGGTVMPEFEAEQAAWVKARDERLAAEKAAAEAKAAAKAAKAAEAAAKKKAEAEGAAAAAPAAAAPAAAAPKATPPEGMDGVVKPAASAPAPTARLERRFW